MEKSKIDTFLSLNFENFDPSDVVYIRESLQNIDDNKAVAIHGLSFQKPKTIFILALLTGWERFFLDDIGLGLAKVLTCYGCFIWWLIDIFSAKKRARKYNIDKFNQLMLVIK